ncbi:MAG: hypothetical protein AB8B73_05555 [Ekhidna sp.]
MKSVKWLISLVSLSLAFFWGIQLYSYFFGAVLADKIGLLLSMLFSFFLLRKVASIISNRPITVFALLVLLPFVVHPLITLLVTFTSIGWLIVHLFVILTVLGVGALFHSKTLYGVPFAFGLVFFVPFSFEKEQLNFYDKIESSIETRFGSAQIAKWKEHFWLYYNGQLQFSTLDGHIYQEAYIQPVMQLANQKNKVLLVGGDSGWIESELSHFRDFVTILPLDFAFHEFARNSPSIPFSSVKNKEVISNTDVFQHLADHVSSYDLIIIDVPDPLNVDYKQYYTWEFYELVFKSLKKDGFMVTQSGDYYKNGVEVQRIWNSVASGGFQTLPYQCQIPTIGQWSWVIGAKSMNSDKMKVAFSEVKENSAIWWNQEAADMIFSFGKPYFSVKTSAINTLNEVEAGVVQNESTQ